MVVVRLAIKTQFRYFFCWFLIEVCIRGLDSNQMAVLVGKHKQVR